MLFKVLPNHDKACLTPKDMVQGAQIRLTIEYPRIAPGAFMSEILSNSAVLDDFFWSTIVVSCRVVQQLRANYWLVSAKKFGAADSGSVDVVLIMDDRNDSSAAAVIGYADYQRRVSEERL